jgi:hypothetical protein
MLHSIVNALCGRLVSSPPPPLPAEIHARLSRRAAVFRRLADEYAPLGTVWCNNNMYVKYSEYEHDPTNATAIAEFNDAYRNAVLCEAASRGDTLVVARMMRREGGTGTGTGTGTGSRRRRVDPSAEHNVALTEAARNGHARTAKSGRTTMKARTCRTRACCSVFRRALSFRRTRRCGRRREYDRTEKELGCAAVPDT